MAYTITPISSLGGVASTKTLAEYIATENTPHATWVERLRLAVDFITPDNTLICIADAWLHEDVKDITPIGLTQQFSASEGLPSTLAQEIGSRRKRAIIGSSQGGTINISKMVVIGPSPLYTLTKHNPTLGINKEFWAEKEWMALVGLNHDKLRTPSGLVVIEGAPDGRNYSAHMYEQCLIQGESTSYQAGQHLVVNNFNFIFEQKVPLWSIGIEEVLEYGSTIE